MTVINRSMYPVQNGMNLVGRMQERFATLQTQLATGDKASTLSELGADRHLSLSMHARISRIAGYQNSIGMLNTRLAMFDKVIQRLDSIESSGRTAIAPSAYGSSHSNFGSVPSMARSQLDEVITLLNTDVDGRYLFGGGTVDKRPVESMSAIIEGAGGKQGFRFVADERLAADQGNGLGRLAINDSVAGEVSLNEDGAHVFGLKLSSVVATGSFSSHTGPGASAPRTLTVAFDTQPNEGDSVTIGFTMPDGTSETITLRAVTGTPANGEFRIGADADATAANFGGALQARIEGLVQAELASASNFAAADNFFNGQGADVMRVGGSDPATATTLVVADPTTTVLWYKGEDTDNPRATVKARVDDATSVHYGAQANESGPLALIRSLAVVGIQNFNINDATAEDRFDAVAVRNFSRLSESHNSEAGSIELIAAELGNAQANAASVSDRQLTYKSQLQGMLSELEGVSNEEVAMEILALQTRLQASYQAISLIAQMSLVNYLK